MAVKVLKENKLLYVIRWVIRHLFSEFDDYNCAALNLQVKGKKFVIINYKNNK